MPNMNYADISSMALDVLTALEGSPADAFLLFLIMITSTIAFTTARNINKLIKTSISTLQDRTEATFKELQEDIRRAFSDAVTDSNKDIAAIRSILEELKEDKMQAGICSERHIAIDDKFRSIDEWRKETNDTLKRHDDKIFEISQRGTLRRAVGD